MTAEDFSNEMVQAFRHDSIERFKTKYRNQCDVLLLEDIHDLSGKQRTQVELALTLDSLFDAGKRIIFSSCYLPDIGYRPARFPHTRQNPAEKGGRERIRCAAGSPAVPGE